MIEKLNRLKNWQAAIVIAVVGFAVYATGLTSPFQCDDIPQIVKSIPVHSIANIKLFFEGGTFYNGQGLAPLSGTYFRPLMTTVFSVIYTLFGPHPFYFHLFQLLLCIGSVILLYLFFRYSFKPGLALALSLIFLVHPLNSQVVYAIPYLQDALFFFFGILGLYLLVRFKTVAGNVFAALSFTLCLLAKETGILFIAIALLYLFWWERKRLFLFIGTITLPVIVWLFLRIHAVGINSNPNSAPIDSLNLIGRLLTTPSVFLFYITKFIFPWKLAAAYYWTYSSFSFRHVLLPLFIDCLVIALFAYAGFRIRKRASKALYYTYLFFSTWAVLGILICSQIIPLEMSACETWFYFSMAGVLGMIGTVKVALFPRLYSELPVFAILIIIAALGVRTAYRGLDWENPYALDKLSVLASREDYAAYDGVAQILINQGKYSEAIPYISKSIKIYPTFNNNLNLGAALTYEGNYPAALNAYLNGLKYNKNSYDLYENIAVLTLVYGKYDSDKQLLLAGLSKFPHSGTLWMILAILDDKNSDDADAKTAITNAAQFSQVSPGLYEYILDNKPFTMSLSNLGLNATVDVR